MKGMETGLDSKMRAVFWCGIPLTELVGLVCLRWQLAGGQASFCHVQSEILKASPEISEMVKSDTPRGVSLPAKVAVSARSSALTRLRPLFLSFISPWWLRGDWLRQVSHQLDQTGSCQILWKRRFLQIRFQTRRNR